jgi:hypothetical protein
MGDKQIQVNGRNRNIHGDFSLRRRQFAPDLRGELRPKVNESYA